MSPTMAAEEDLKTAEAGNGEPQNEKTEDDGIKTTGLLGWWGYRHTITVISFFALAVGYAQRVDLSIGIVAMTDWNSTKETETENS
ncbi:hypothetical protein J437_LFUL015293 [Ladona fulva]|uniref:Uncharacterized protein n=1 Tax=Ladona fulva TaxID=123851 RepID=A0A8K0KJ50_LADFU|nr:hypothetical protein J437_LFUL015293 [Ladona fulva]